MTGTSALEALKAHGENKKLIAQKRITTALNDQLQQKQAQEQSKKRLIEQENEAFNAAIKDLDDALNKTSNSSNPNANELIHNAKKIFPKASSERRRELMMVIQWAKETLQGIDSQDQIKDCVIREMEKKSFSDVTAYRIMMGIGWIVLGIVLGIGVGYFGAYFVFPISESSLRGGYDPGFGLLVMLCFFPLYCMWAGISCLMHEPSLGREVKQFGNFFKVPDNLKAPLLNDLKSIPLETKELDQNTGNVCDLP